MASLSPGESEAITGRRAGSTGAQLTEDVGRGARGQGRAREKQQLARGCFAGRTGGACPVIAFPAGTGASLPLPYLPPSPQPRLRLCRRSLGTTPPGPPRCGFRPTAFPPWASVPSSVWDSEVTKHNDPHHQSCHREHETCCRRPEKPSPGKGSTRCLLPVGWEAAWESQVQVRGRRKGTRGPHCTARSTRAGKRADAGTT